MVAAQSNYSVVRGLIFDPYHRPVAGARTPLPSTMNMGGMIRQYFELRQRY